MVSFDVNSLYTNIPIIDTAQKMKFSIKDFFSKCDQIRSDALNIIHEYINNDDQFTRKTAIHQDRFLDPVNLVLTTIWYTFDTQFY